MPAHFLRRIIRRLCVVCVCELTGSCYYLPPFNRRNNPNWALAFDAAAVYRDQGMVAEAAMATADTLASSKNRADPAGTPRCPCRKLNPNILMV
jgi:hypothetical protein